MGIRNIREIENLPVNQLTDDEICKLFVRRFDAKALVMVYTDKEGKYYSFGRSMSDKETFARYRRCIRYCWDLIHTLTSNIYCFAQTEDWNRQDQSDKPFDLDGHYIKRE